MNILIQVQGSPYWVLTCFRARLDLMLCFLQVGKSKQGAVENQVSTAGILQESRNGGGSQHLTILGRNNPKSQGTENGP